MGTFRAEDLLDAAREGLKQVERSLRSARRHRPQDVERIQRCEASLKRMRAAVRRLGDLCDARAGRPLSAAALDPSRRRK